MVKQNITYEPAKRGYRELHFLYIGVVFEPNPSDHIECHRTDRIESNQSQWGSIERDLKRAPPEVVQTIAQTWPGLVNQAPRKMVQTVGPAWSTRHPRKWSKASWPGLDTPAPQKVVQTIVQMWPSLVDTSRTVSYTHLTLPTIYSV